MAIQVLTRDTTVTGDCNISWRELQPVTITSMEVSGGNVVITMSDGSTTTMPTSALISVAAGNTIQIDTDGRFFENDAITV